MADKKQSKTLRRSVEEWNAWREKNTLVPVDLSDADLKDTNLRGAHLRGADLGRADLSFANLKFANLRGANLMRANLSNADLSEADLSRADLKFANFTATNLESANLSEAQAWQTVFGDLDLGAPRNLETVIHVGPSVIGIDTLHKSQGRIPDAFLSGCGIKDWEIEHAKIYKLNLSNEAITDITYRVANLRTTQPIQIAPVFISYNHEDESFAARVEGHLDTLGVRYWRDAHDLVAGPVEDQIDRAISMSSAVLLVLSSKSVESDWVEWEAAKARKAAKEGERHVLCPVALDDSWKTCDWDGPLRKQIEKYHILDFSDWEDETVFEGQAKRLQEGLQIFYRDSGVPS